VGEREQERRREEGGKEAARHRGFVARDRDGGRSCRGLGHGGKRERHVGAMEQSRIGESGR
jgi:hypothetical protein